MDDDSVRSFGFSADGQRLAVGWQNGGAEIWNVQPPRLIKKLDDAEDQTGQNLRREVWDARRAAFDRLRPRAAADHTLTRRLTNSATAPTTVCCWAAVSSL